MGVIGRSLKAARRQGIVYDEALALLHMCEYLRPTMTAAALRQHLSKVGTCWLRALLTRPAGARAVRADAGARRAVRVPEAAAANQPRDGHRLDSPHTALDCLDLNAKKI